MSLHLQCRMMESVLAGEAGVTLVTGLAALPAQHIGLFFPVPAVTAPVNSRNGLESVKRRAYNVAYCCPRLGARAFAFKS